MIKIELQVHAVADGLPDADTDVLVFDGVFPEAVLGAYIGDDDGQPLWADAQGQGLAGVTHWAEMPCLPKPAGAAQNSPQVIARDTSCIFPACQFAGCRAGCAGEAVGVGG